MNKKVIQSLFSNICCKDELKVVMKGVHFEKERCYATDGHLLVIYNEGSSKYEGKTMDANGNEIEGKYPAVDKVIPNKDKMSMVDIDLGQLKEACAYYMKSDEYNTSDRVLINDVLYNIRNLYKMLSTLATIDSLSKFKMYSKDCISAVLLTHNKATGLLMPMMKSGDDIVDCEKNGKDDIASISYENLINDYVFNSWKKKEKVGPLDWLD